MMTHQLERLTCLVNQIQRAAFSLVCQVANPFRFADYPRG